MTLARRNFLKALPAALAAGGIAAKAAAARLAGVGAVGASANHTANTASVGYSAATPYLDSESVGGFMEAARKRVATLLRLGIPEWKRKEIRLHARHGPAARPRYRRAALDIAGGADANAMAAQ